jgi:RHS repeat-associated protein
VPDENGTNRQKLTSVTVLGPGSPNRVTHTWGFSYRDAANPNLAYGGTCTGDLCIARTDPTGLVTSYRYQSVNSPSRPTEDDWMGRISSVRWLDSSEGTTVEKVITRTASGQTGTLTYPGSVVRQYTYSTDYTLTSVYHPGADRLWQYSSDPQRNIRTIRGPAERYTTSPLTEISYVKDGDGHITQETVKTRQADDTLGDPVETQYNALNLPTQVKRYARPYTGVADLVTRLEYDGGGTLTQGNLTRVIEAYGTAEQRETQHFYEGSWGLRSRTRNAVGGDTLYGYDSATGWLLSTASPQNLVVGSTHPDRPSSVTATAYMNDGLPAQTTDPEGHVVLISYNAAASGSPNLVTTFTFADGSYTQVTVDAFGRTLETRDEKGVRTQWTYNPEGGVKTTRRAVGPADERLTVNYYDLRGDLVAIDPPGGSAGRIQFEYNRYDQYGTLALSGGNPIYEGEVTRILHADGSDEGRGWNAPGEPAWERKADGSVLYLGYDAARRHTATVYPAHGSEAAFTVVDTPDEFGRIVSRSDRTGTTTATFDALNRPVLVTPPSPQKAMSFTYTPDTVLQRWITTVSVADVGSYQYREDSKGRTCEVINPFSQSFWSEFSPDGKQVLEVHPNGVREERSYTGRDWLAGILYRKADGSVLDTLNYFYTDSLGVYDPTGRLQREVDGLAQTHAFSYNNLGELVAESHPDIGSVSYTIDANGNRSSKTTAAGTDYYGVTAANKLLWVNRGTNAAPTSGQSAPYTLFTYDVNGCMTQRERRYDGGLLKTLDFIWDSDERLRQIKEGATTRFSADYRGDGLRVGKWDSWTGQHDYTWGPSGIVYDSSGTTVLTPGLSQRSGSTDRFFQEDWIGSARYLTDSTGNSVPSALRYDAFGGLSALAGSAYPTEFEFVGKFGYQSEYQDASDPGLGLDYLQQRSFDPAAGRFISRDPIGFKGGLNLYNYAGGNPVSNVDPTGEDPTKEGPSPTKGRQHQGPRPRPRPNNPPTPRPEYVQRPSGWGWWRQKNPRPWPPPPGPRNNPEEYPPGFDTNIPQLNPWAVAATVGAVAIGVVVLIAAPEVAIPALVAAF